jgi:hypothetical protein
LALLLMQRCVQQMVRVAMLAMLAMLAMGVAL